MVVLLDSNIVVDLFRGQHSAPKRILACTEIFIPAIVCGKLLFGAANSPKPAIHRQQVLGFLKSCKFLETNFAVAENYALVRKHLKIKGMPIPENDFG